MRWPLLARRTHKWLTLIIGVQALLWVISGLYMTIVHLDFIHGDHLVRPAPARPIDLRQLVDPSALKVAGGPVTDLRLERQDGRAVYIARTAAGATVLDAATGQPLSPLNPAYVRRLALERYAGQGGIVSIALLDQSPQEVRSRPAPLWRVEFEGWARPTLYFSHQTGELLAKRHDFWRVFDFVWMFHIMDYEARENVNNLLLRMATWLAVASSATGAWLLFYSFRRRRRKRPQAA